MGGPSQCCSDRTHPRLPDKAHLSCQAWWPQVHVDVDMQDAQSFVLGKLVKIWWACATSNISLE